jgi:thiamine pyrophosphate-dependent acetolactate synthase large subunit-like protein
MSLTVGDFLARRLHEWGVRRIYGYPGDGINGITAGLRRLGKIEFVQVRHEESAEFAACVHVKYGGGSVGVCLATSGPGAVHLLNGLYDAKLDHQPVVAIVGLPSCRYDSFGDAPIAPVPARRRLRRHGCSSRGEPHDRDRSVLDGVGARDKRRLPTDDLGAG